MKIRLGFVSNSSTVNFLIVTKEELTEKMLQKQLENSPITRTRSIFYTKELWRRIDYELKEECKPYEYEFYELTLGKGLFHYYPGGFVNDDERLWPIQGKKIEIDDFLLYIGYFERYPDWYKKKIKIQYVNLKGKDWPMYGVHLSLSYRDISKISEIKGLTSLKNLMTLNLHGNKIRNLKGLRELKDLRLLELQNNEIEDINGLENCTNLEKVNLSYNLVQKVNIPLQRLEKLEDLWLYSNRITEIGELESKSLENLSLNINRISKLKPLKLESLKRLDLSKNQLRKISALDYLINLESLLLNDNPISVLEGLDNLTNLKYLNVHNCPIREIKNLDKLTNLEHIKLANTQITEIKGLEELRNLRTLDLSNSKITEIKGLENLESLRSLDLTGTNISRALVKKLGGYNTRNELTQNFVNYCRRKK